MMPDIKSLGALIGTYSRSAAPIWMQWLSHLPWLRSRYANRMISEMLVYEHGIQLLCHGSAPDRTLLYADIRRVWFERFTTGSEQPGHTAFRIDLIAHDLNTLFTLTKADCATSDPQLCLMDRLYQAWRTDTWRHYNVVAAVVRLTAAQAGREDLAPDTPVYLCMQKGLTRYAYTTEHWEFPGGKVEEGETEPQALRRELQEEMDYDVNVERHLITIDHRYPDFGLTMACYLCTASDAHFVRKEHRDHRWLTPDEMADLPWCEADAPVKDVL